MCAVEFPSCGMVYIPSFVEIGRGVQFCLINLRGCNVGITDGRDL
jgi:hypothetical protein